MRGNERKVALLYDRFTTVWSQEREKCSIGKASGNTLEIFLLAQFCQDHQEGISRGAIYIESTFCSGTSQAPDKQCYRGASALAQRGLCAVCHVFPERYESSTP